MGFGVNRKDNTMFASAVHEVIAEVQSVGKCVDFQGGTRALGGRADRIGVEIDRQTTTENAASPMADNADVGVPNGGEWARVISSRLWSKSDSPQSN